MTTQVFDAAHARYLGEQRHGVLATIAASGFPQTKPVGFRYDPRRGTIEVSGYDMEHSAKFRNVAANPLVAFTISDVPNQDAGSAGIRFMEVRGVAEQARLDEPMIAGISPWIIRIHPRRLVSYNVAGSGGHATDLAGEAAAPQRPAAGLTGAAADRAREAVASQVAELQAGLADGDSETYNRRFADDVMWGSPYGATVDGYDALHAIHRRLHSSGHGRSRYEIVRVLTPTPGVALAQVRRDALDEEGEPIPSHAGESRFSEMALYVLVRRGGMWWLAAGQNTVIDIDNGAVAQ